MQIFAAASPVRSVIAAGTVALAIALPLGMAQAQQTTYPMKISTPVIHDIPNVWLDAAR